MGESFIRQTLNEDWDKHPSNSFVFVDETRQTGRRRVGRTDFLRNRESVEHLINFLATLPSKPLRVLSAPCSIGCESYSLAMLAEAMGLYDRRNLQIDALDLSPLFVAAAQEGVYPAAMFAEPFPPEMQKHFHNAADGMIGINDNIKNRVNFLPAQDLTTLQREIHYDALVMMNLLIHLHDAEITERLAQTIDRLNPSAILLNNIFLVKRTGDQRNVIPYPHWHLLEDALRRNNYITAGSGFDNFPVYAQPPRNLQDIVPKRNDATILFVKSQHPPGPAAF